MKYCNLAVHSSYDLLNSTIKLEDIFEKVHRYGGRYICITDPNMYAAIKSHKLAIKYNINLIHALEVVVNKDFDVLRVHILCKNEKMFYKLLELSSSIQTEEREFVLDDLCIELKGYSNDCLLIFPDELKSLRESKEILDVLGEYECYFSYNENYDYNIYANLKNIVFGKDSYYLNKEDYQTLVVLRAIKDNSKLTISELVSKYGDNYVYTEKDIVALLDNVLNPLQLEVLKIALANQQKIVESCNYKLQFSGYNLPKYVYGEDEQIFADRDSLEYLKYLVLKGVKKKLRNKDLTAYKRRIEYELRVISEMGFVDYFLIVQDFVNYAKRNGIYVGSGRGSSVGSLVCYLLNITDVDPVEYNLLFERFLNKERISMPDIDIDFQDNRRDEVIKYVEKKYGEDKVAQITTFTTLQSKSAARESARILQFSDGDLKRISNLINSTATLQECYNNSIELRNFVQQSEKYERWFAIAKSLENLPRNKSVHAAGVVISDQKKLNEHVALELANVTKYLTQWTMEDVEYVGLLKIDFLGIRYLTMVNDIVQEIKKSKPDFDIDSIDLRDKKVYQIFATGKTEGIFQFESSGMKEKLRMLQPSEFNDIFAMNALYRPGPMAQIETYIRRKHKKEEIKYIHPKLERTLRETYGVIVYQEQIMLIAVNFANMTLTEADNMRRAVSKKKKEDLEKYGKIFISKAVAQGHDMKIATELYQLIVTFANYGFNKSHAVAYSMLAYKLAYLKCYYSKYFMTALLNNVISSEKKINEYKQEITNMGIKLLHPNVNLSSINFSVVKNNIIFALLAIKNVGYRSATEIVTDRERFGKYESIDDFLRRMDKKVDYQAAVSLVKAGALDVFGYNRATIMKKVKDYYEDTRENIDTVRFALSNNSGLTLKVEEIEEFSIQEKIAMEKEATGTYFLKHPAQAEKERYSYLPLKYLANKPTDSYVEITSIKEIKTKNGETMAFLTVNDGLGDYEVTIFPSVYKYISVLLKEYSFLVVTVKPQIRNDRLQYILEKATTLEKYKKFCMDNIKQIYVLVDEENEQLIKRFVVPSGTVQLICVFNNSTKKRELLYVKDEQEFVRNMLELYPEKSIKINYR